MTEPYKKEKVKRCCYHCIQRKNTKVAYNKSVSLRAYNGAISISRYTYVHISTRSPLYFSPFSEPWKRPNGKKGRSTSKDYVCSRIDDTNHSIEYLPTTCMQCTSTFYISYCVRFIEMSKQCVEAAFCLPCRLAPFFIREKSDSCSSFKCNKFWFEWQIVGKSVLWFEFFKVYPLILFLS